MEQVAQFGRKEGEEGTSRASSLFGAVPCHCMGGGTKEDGETNKVLFLGSAKRRRAPEFVKTAVPYPIWPREEKVRY